MKQVVVQRQKKQEFLCMPHAEFCLEADAVEFLEKRKEFYKEFGFKLHSHDLKQLKRGDWVLKAKWVKHDVLDMQKRRRTK